MRLSARILKQSEEREAIITHAFFVW